MISDNIRAALDAGSAIRAMFEKGGQLKKRFGEENVFDFSLGNPNIAPPEKINAEIIRIVSENPADLHAYMPNAGYAFVRRAIAEKLGGENNGFCEEGVVMTCGAAAGLNITLGALLNPGESVIVIAPFFVEYVSYVKNHGGAVTVVPADEQTFLFDAERIKNAITDKTKAIILNSPNNPTGVVYPKALLTEMAGVLRAHKERTGRDIYVISDEPYAQIIYDGAQFSPMYEIFENAVTVSSYSKSLSLAGERIGYVAVSKKAADFDALTNALILLNRVLGFVNAPALFQRVIYACLDESVDVSAYRKKRDILYNHLTALGFSCFLPQGAFYLFPRSPIDDDKKFCAEYALKYNILLTPGSAFYCPGFFRIAYCVSDGVIERSLPKFTALAETLKTQ